MRGPAIAVVLSVALTLAAPGGLLAVSGWSMTATPTAFTRGATTDVTLRVTDTQGSGDHGCLRLVIPAAFTVLGTAVLATTAPAPWTATASGSGPTTLRVRNPDGNGKLKADDWVDFRVTVRGDQSGSYGWTGEVFQNNDCSSDPDLAPITLTMTVSSPAPTPTPTPAPTPTPTPAPTPTPTPAPTPTPTPAPTPTSTPATPAPTSSPQQTASPSPAVTPRPTPAGSPTPGPAGSDQPTVTAAPEGSTIGPTGSGPPASGDVAVSPAPGTTAAPPPGPSSAGAAGPSSPGGGSPGPALRFPADANTEALSSLSLGFEGLALLGGGFVWLVPGFVAGVPGLLVIVLLIVQMVLGRTWIRHVERLLGPEPPQPPDQEHLWWAAGRPIGH